jgi:hypothetical protein
MTLVLTGEVFSFSDVTRNSLQYQHTVLSKQEDAITFSVSDGISMATTVVQVVILEAGADGPRKDPGSVLSLEVGEKSSTVLRRSHLAYTVTHQARLAYTVIHLSVSLSYNVNHLAGSLSHTL